MELPFFGKKKKAEEPKGRGYIPSDRARELMSRGFSELDTIDVLRREGFSPDEIDKSLTQVVKEGVVGSAGQAGPAMPPPAAPVAEDFNQAYQTFRQQRPTPTFPPKRETSKEEKPKEEEKSGFGLKLPTIEELQPQRAQVPPMPETTLPEEYYQGYPTEEYIDYAVQERTQDILERLNEFTVRNKELESRLKEMNERVRELAKVRTGEQQRVLGSVEELKDTISDVNTRMASLEKAFKETLPALIESVRALSDLVQRMKSES